MDERFAIEKVVINGFKKITGALELALNPGMNILVGNNGAGKSTLIEAICLALTGRYRGIPINRCISESLFNSEEVRSFINSATANVLADDLPAIVVDVYLSGGDKTTRSEWTGCNNIAHLPACGFSFRISFNGDFIEELREFICDGIESLPVEYYEATWMSFAGEKVTVRKLPMTAVLINPNGETRSSYGPDRATRSLLDVLPDSSLLRLAQAARRGRETFRDLADTEKIDAMLAQSELLSATERYLST